jgi:hypothetical protein
MTAFGASREWKTPYLRTASRIAESGICRDIFSARFSNSFLTASWKKISIVGNFSFLESGVIGNNLDKIS